MTFAEFEKTPYSELPQELLDGQLITLTPRKLFDEKLIRGFRGLFCTVCNRNLVWSKRGFHIGPHWLIPDASVEWPDQPVIDGYVCGAPMIAVEVASNKRNDAEQLDRKIQIYLAEGAVEAWVVFPQTRSMMIFRRNTDQPLRVTRTYDCKTLNLTIDLEKILAAE